MHASNLKHSAIRAAVLGALMASTAGAALAQAKPQGPPATTKGAVKSNPKADKGQATAAAARTAARERKAENNALKSARSEPKALLKGMRFSPYEKRLLGAVEKRYAGQFKQLETADKASDKAGAPDAAYRAKLDALRLQERAELRAILTPQQQVVYDQNIVVRDADQARKADRDSKR
jgi:hypothetical protein